jgi:hypothetical protein
VDKNLQRSLQSVAKATVVILLTAMVGCGGFIYIPGPGTEGPRVQGVYPMDGSTDVPLNATVQATFNKSMDPSSISASTFTLSAAGPLASPSIKAVEGTVTYVAATRTAVLTPAANLGEFTFYTATVSGEVKDTSGNTMGEDYTWQFRTADLVAPDVASTDPADGETDVGDTPEVTVTFTEDVNEDTVDGNSFRVNKGAEQVAGSVGAEGSVATFTPDDDLKCGETYSGLVTTAIEDLGGTPLASNYAWTWTMAPGRWVLDYATSGSNEGGTSIAQTSDGGYIMVGSINGIIAGAGDTGWILKLGPSGAVEWEKAVGFPAGGVDIFRWVEQTSDGGYIAAGQTNKVGSGNLDMWVVKFDADGDIEWENVYGGPEDDGAYEIHQIASGGYIIGGSREIVGNTDGWVVELNATGAVANEFIYGPASIERIRSIKQLPDGSYIAAGSTSTFVTEDFWVMKLTAAFAVTWSYYYQPTVNQDFATSVIRLSDGSYVVFGETLFGGVGGYDLWFMRITTAGAIQWENAYGGASNEHASKFAVATDGGFVLSGWTSSFSPRTDGWLVKLDKDGNIEWDNIYGGVGEDRSIRDVIGRSDGGYVGVGNRSDGTVEGYRAWAFSVDGDGEVDAACPLVNPSSGIRTPTAAATGVFAVVPNGTAEVTIPTSATVVDIPAAETTQCASECAPITP